LPIFVGISRASQYIRKKPRPPTGDRSFPWRLSRTSPRRKRGARID
jgi:hypothetical protein